MTHSLHDARFDALGVSLLDGGANFKIYSESATSIWLNLLDASGQEVMKRVDLEQTERGIWTGFAEQVEIGTNYTLGADGPAGPRHAFDAERELLDPYARGLVRRSPRDYHCVVVTDSFDWQGVTKPRIPMAQSILYEAHVRGLSRINPNVPAEIRGSYAALGHPATIEHLVTLGITAIELLPIHAIISEPRLINLGLINYWGYNSINFFTPHMRYAAESTRAAGPSAIAHELKTAIRELHRAGIEVILDVVYNHTAEGGFNGLSYSYRGLDNSNYYRLDDAGNYQDSSGCGNTLDFSNPAVQRLALDSLRHWADDFQIDGFRFDLATSMARDSGNHFDPYHPLLTAITNDPVLSESKLVVEPWDVGLGGWQTGNFPARFAEWNDRFRDSVRKFWLSDIAIERNSGQAPDGLAEFASRISGSQDIFHSKPSPLEVVNFVTAHDGFTLADLVSFNQKQNSANGEGNRDGSNNNHSFDHGAEGETKNPKIRAARRKAARNLLGSLLLGAGTPMLTAGDERGKSQSGNNNAYCQDNTTSWLSWNLDSHQADLETTVKYLINLRKTHGALRAAQFAGDWTAENTDMHGHWLAWFSAAGHRLGDDDWRETHRSVQRLSVVTDSNESSSRLLLAIHGTETEAHFALPLSLGGSFALLWDSALELPPKRPQIFAAGARYRMSETSLQLFLWQPDTPDIH